MQSESDVRDSATTSVSTAQKKYCGKNCSIFAISWAIRDRDRNCPIFPRKYRARMTCRRAEKKVWLDFVRPNVWWKRHPLRLGHREVVFPLALRAQVPRLPGLHGKNIVAKVAAVLFTLGHTESWWKCVVYAKVLCMSDFSPPSAVLTITWMFYILICCELAQFRYSLTLRKVS